MNSTHTQAIEVSNLTKTFGRHRAVDAIDFRVERGRVTALLGPNGAGKTTTMRMLLGLISVDDGHALIDGRPYARLQHPARTVGVVLDAGGLHPSRTGRQHLRITAAMIGRDAAAIDSALRQVGLHDAADRAIGGYSLGMRQRLALANALLGDPSILVLDEPANGLDPAGIRWLREYLRSFAQRGGTVLISTHVLTEVTLVADDVIIIAAGKVLTTGPLAEVTAGHGDDLEQLYLSMTETEGTEAL
jgi:ABC-2 type transport system ATP-binding protein